MRKGNLFLFASLLIVALSHGQVNLQTGAAQFSLPLYNYQDVGNRIGCSVSLNYVDGNGLKVNEIASCVGTGWSLQFGGEISRLQKGEPDDQPEYRLPIPGASTTHYFPNGYLYSESQFHPSIQVTNGGAYVPLNFTKKEIEPPKKFLVDREQDVFRFTFNGRTGEFIIGRDGSIHTIMDSKLRIAKSSDPMASNIRTTISAFTITDETGIQYIFKDRELSEVLKYDYIQLASGQTMLANAFDDNNTCAPWFATNGCRYTSYGRGIGQFVVSKWCLSEIFNPMTNTKITFGYEDYSFDINGNINFQKAYTDGKPPKFSLSVAKIKGMGKRIKEIVCSEKEKVVFGYNYLLARQDLPGDYPLGNIKIFYGNDCKLQWNFTLGYTGRTSILPLTYSPGPLGTTSGSEKPYMRLCLLSVQKAGIGGLMEPAYGFTYNLGNPADPNNQMPARFSYYHDHWGYSNATTGIWESSPLDDFGNEDLGLVISSSFMYNRQLTDPMAKRQTVDKLAQNGILKSVKYPAGGILAFEYEQNNAFFNNANTSFGGVRVKSTTTFDGLNHNNDIVLTYKYTEENGSSSGWGYEVPVYSRDADMTIWKAGDYKYAAFLMNVTASTLIGNFIPKSIETVYWNSWRPGTTITETTSPSVINAAANMIVGYLITQVFEAIASYDDFISHGTYSDALNSGNPLPFQYRRVEVVSSPQANNGKTVYEFTSPADPDIPDIAIPILGFPFTNKQRCAAWAYGLPIVISVYDKDSRLQKMTVNTYNPDPIVSTLTDENYRSQNWRPARTVFRIYGEVINLWNSTETSYIASDRYLPLVGHMELKETKEYRYNANGQAAVATTTFFYNSDYQVSRIESHNSKNELLETRTYYPSDYTQTGTIQILKDTNIISVPVATQTFITKTDGKYLLSGSVNEFGTARNGDIKVIANHQFESAVPVQASLVPFSPTQLIPNVNYYKDRTFIEYNSAGLPKTVTANTKKSAVLYDYENKLPTANILNASADDVSYTSFETENKGNWSYDEQYAISDFSPTGKSCFQFPQTTTSLLSGLLKGYNYTSQTGDTPYTLSFWCKGGTPFILKTTTDNNLFYQPAAATLTKTYQNAATGWTYYEYSVANARRVVLSNQMVIEGNATGAPKRFLLDEVRLYPSNARLQTTTYDPLVGKTSECDSNGRITYYSYDGLGRLKMIRDENRNVIKAYEYKTVSQ